MRVGVGFDAHAFDPGRPLVLGGIEIPHSAGLGGHSDADVVLHAVIDALLGAAGAGDIGNRFPAEDRFKDASSVELLSIVVSELRARAEIYNVDVSVIAEAPRLAGHVSAMRERIASALEIDADRVSVKATTTDGMGFTGRGEGIAAIAVALLKLTD